MGYTMETKGQAAGVAVELQQASTCPTCGATIAGKFCPVCGEKKFDRDHFSLKNFSHEALHELAHFDSKIFRTVRYLFTKPGFIAQEYLAGKRSRYVNPLRAYLFCFALVLFLYSVYRPVFDVGEAAKVDKTGIVQKMLIKQAHKHNVPEERLVEHFNEHWHFYMELARILDAFIVSGILAVLYRRRKWYFAEHAVVALYFLSFTSLLNVALWPVHVATGGLASRAKNVVFLLLTVPYMWMMLRRVYQDRAGTTTLKTLLLFVATQISAVLTTAMSLILATIHTLITIR